MDPSSRGQPLLPSVLDRLLHPDPGSGGKGRGAALREHRREHRQRDLKECIRRDLEDLLNTRWRASSWPPGLEELETSLVNYGIPDFTGANLGSPTNQEEFRRVLERVIRRYEPRFKSVKVQLLKNPDPMDRALRFRIEALLRTEPAPEPVVFDSELKPITASFEIKGGQ